MVRDHTKAVPARCVVAPRWRRLLVALAAVSALTASCSTSGLSYGDEESTDEDVEPAEEERLDPGRRDGGVRPRPDPGGSDRPRMRDAGTRDARVLLDARLSSDAEGPRDGASDPLACLMGSTFPVQASRLRPLEGYDYIAVREAAEPLVSGDGGVDEWTSSTFRTLSEAGVRCARAVGGGTCAQKVAFHPQQLANPVCMGNCSERAIVTTRGDEVRRWASASELSTLFGPIDSPDEALMLAAATGYWLSCDGGPHSSVAELDDGYEVEAIRYLSLCPVRIELARLHVSFEGRVTLRSMRELPRSDAPCVGSSR